LDRDRDVGRGLVPRPIGLHGGPDPIRRVRPIALALFGPALLNCMVVRFPWLPHHAAGSGSGLTLPPTPRSGTYARSRSPFGIVARCLPTRWSRPALSTCYVATQTAARYASSPSASCRITSTSLPS